MRSEDEEDDHFEDEDEDEDVRAGLDGLTAGGDARGHWQPVGVEVIAC